MRASFQRSLRGIPKKFNGGERGFAIAGLLLFGFVPEVPSPARPARVETTQFVPPGTVIPVRLDETLDVKSLQAQLKIAARVAQEVPLPSKEKISLRSRVFATVTA